MRLYYLFFLGVLSNLINCAPIIEDFDIACGWADSYYHKIYDICIKSETISKEWLGGFTDAQAFMILRNVYNDRFLQRALYGPFDSYRIPKIIHIIWLGSKFPKKYEKWLDSWKKFHPQWKVILWTDKTVKKLKLINRDLFNATDNYGEKADILRIELLFQFGGLYVDTDFECLQPFDELHKTCDFFAGMAQLDIFNAHTAGVLIPNALIASRAGHPLLLKIINNMRQFRSMPGISERTGPWLFTRSFFEYISQEDNQKLLSVIFPPTYFYPISNYAIQRYGKGYSDDCIKRETYANHYYEASWAK